MKLKQLKETLAQGALSSFSHLYRDIEHQTARMILALDRFAQLYGEDRDVALFSVPGRSELTGNHTDHNLGCVLAGAIDRDIIAVASRNEDGIIRFQSENSISKISFEKVWRYHQKLLCYISRAR